MKTQFVFFVVDFMLVSAYLLVLVQQNLRKIIAKIGNNETQNTRHNAGFQRSRRPHNGPAFLP